MVDTKSRESVSGGDHNFFDISRLECVQKGRKTPTLEVEERNGNVKNVSQFCLLFIVRRSRFLSSLLANYSFHFFTVNENKSTVHGSRFTVHS